MSLDIRKKASADLISKSMPLVSVIVPTLNSERYLESCLTTIRKQTYPHIEIIVVDNHSKDRTMSIASKYADLCLSGGKERSAQVNLGVKKAHGEFIYRVDSDFVVEPKVVEEAVSKCTIEGFDAVCVPNTSDASVGYWAAVRKLERDCYAGDLLNVAARFIRKDAFETIGGFDENLVAGEDYDLHNRLLKYGFRIGEARFKELHIGEPTQLSEIALKYNAYGKTIMRFIHTNREKAIMQVSPLRSEEIRFESQTDSRFCHLSACSILGYMHRSHRSVV